MVLAVSMLFVVPNSSANSINITTYLSSSNNFSGYNGSNQNNESLNSFNITSSNSSNNNGTEENTKDNVSDFEINQSGINLIINESNLLDYISFNESYSNDSSFNESLSSNDSYFNESLSSNDSFFNESLSSNDSYFNDSYSNLSLNLSNPYLNDSFNYTLNLSDNNSVYSTNDSLNYSTNDSFINESKLIFDLVPTALLEENIMLSAQASRTYSPSCSGASGMCSYNAITGTDIVCTYTDTLGVGDLVTAVQMNITIGFTYSQPAVPYFNNVASTSFSQSTPSCTGQGTISRTWSYPSYNYGTTNTVKFTALEFRTNGVPTVAVTYEVGPPATCNHTTTGVGGNLTASATGYGGDTFNYKFCNNNDSDCTVSWSTNNNFTVQLNDAHDYMYVMCQRCVGAECSPTSLNSTSKQINNSLPTVPTEITVNNVSVGQTLIANATGSTDTVDNDTISSHYYEFYNINSSSIVQNYSTNNTYVIKSTDAKDTIRIRSFAFDGYGNSTSYFEKNTTINNTAPVATSSITPEPMFASDIARFYCSASDSDDTDTSVAYNYTIYKNGVVYKTASTYSGSMVSGYEDTTNWDKKINGGSSSSSDQAKSIVVSPLDGSVYVVGNGEYLVSGSTNSDWWIKKFNAQGVEDTLNWNKTYDGGLYDYMSSNFVSSDGSLYVVGSAWGIVSGSSNYDWWIKKFNSNGVEDTTNWNKTISGGDLTRSDNAHSVFVSPIDDSVYVVGDGVNLVSGSSGYDWRIKKFWNNGTEDVVNWNKNYSFDTSSMESAQSVFVSPIDGSVFVAGYGNNYDWLIKKFNSSGFEDVVWNKTLDGGGWDYAYSIFVNSLDGSVYVVGSGRNLVSGSSDADWWIKKFWSNGTEDVVNWNKKYNGGVATSADSAQSVFVSSLDGSVYVFGTGRNLVSGSTNDDWLIKKFNSSGFEDTLKWNKTYSGTDLAQGDYAFSVFNSPLDGGVYVAGGGYDLVSGSSNVDWWIKKFNEVNSMNKSIVVHTIFTNLTIGDNYSITCSSYDGFNWSSWSSNYSSVVNADAVLNSVSTSNGTSGVIYRSETLRGYCNASSKDANISYDYNWYVNGSVVSSGSIYNVSEELLFNVANLSLTTYAPWQNVIFSCSAEKDGYNTPWMNSSSVLILNRVPTSGSFSSPVGLFASSTLLFYCNASDGDSMDNNISFNFKVYKNGVVFNQSATSRFTQAQLPINFWNVSSLTIGDNWSVMCQANDSYNVSSWSSNYSSVVNADSVLNSVSTSNGTSGVIYRSENLLGYCNASSKDNNVSYNYKWFVGGTQVANGSVINVSEEINFNVANLSLTTYAPWQYVIFSCSAEKDGYNTPWLNSSSVLILNHIPTNSVSSVQPTTLFVTDTLLFYCNASDSDSMDDNISFNFNIYKNSIIVNQSSTNRYAQAQLPINFLNQTSLTIGDNWSVMCQANDSYNLSSWSSNYSIIVNADSVVSSVTISPTPTFIRSNILQGFCNASGRAGIVNLSVQWYKNNVAYGLQTNVTDAAEDTNYNVANLSGVFSVYDSWMLSCSANVGNYNSPWMNSTASSVVNTVPVQTTIPRIESTLPVTTDNITGYCNGTDVDGDNLQYEWKWYRNNTEYSSSISSWYVEGLEKNLSIINSSQTQSGETWIFSCRLNDSYNVTAWQNSSTVQILNTISSITTPSISQSTAYTNESITCTYTINDNDTTDTLNAYVNWYKNETLDHTNIEQIVNGVEHSSYLYENETTKHDIWACGIIPNDGYSNNTEKNSTNVTILNHQLMLSDIEIIRSYVETSAIEFLLNYTDIDDDSGNIYVIWSKNNENVENDTIIVDSNDRYFTYFNTSYVNSDNITLKFYGTDTEEYTTNFTMGVLSANDSILFTNEEIRIFGKGIYYNDTIQEGREINLFINGIYENATTINATGDYSFLFTENNLSRLGMHSVVINLTDNLLSHINSSLQYSIWAPTIGIVNIAPTYSVGGNSNYTFGAYYNRTDSNQTIIGTFNITITNGTTSNMISCASAQNCTGVLTVGTTGDLRAGNFSIYFNATNNSAYYWPFNSERVVYFEEPFTTISYTAQNITLDDLVPGEIRYVGMNINISNSFKATMHEVNITPIFMPTNVFNITQTNNCGNISPSTNCNTLFNISFSGNAEVGSHLIQWRMNWTNNDGTISSNTFFTKVQVIGNPGIAITPTIVNKTQNISSTSSYIVNVSNIGNEQLSSLPTQFITIDVAGINRSWLSFNSEKGTNEGAWDAVGERFYLLTTHDYFDLIMNVTLDNFTPANYTGIITISGEASARNVSDNLTLNIVVAPRINISNEINLTLNHNDAATTNINISSIGNAKLTDVNLTFNGSACEFLTFNTSVNNFVGNITEGESVNVLVDVLIPEFTDPGDYLCIINSSSTNMQSIETRINLQVLPSGTWYFEPATNTTKEINLNQDGEIVNITIFNTGNIPINFTIDYDKTITGDNGETCLGNFQPNLDCLDYYDEGYNPSNVYVPKNGSVIVPIWTVGDDTSHSNIPVKISFSNSSATPTINETYIFITLLNFPPTIVNLTIKDLENNFNSVELNKNLTLVAYVGDDELGRINTTSAYFNITIGNVTYTEYPTYSAFFMTEYFGSAKFTLNFNKTNISTIANVSFFVEDLSGNTAILTSNFSINSTTSLSAMTTTVATNSIRYNRNQISNITIDITNLGRTHVYNLSLNTTGLPANFTGSYLVVADMGFETTTKTINITIPQGTVPGTYYYNVTMKFTNPDGSQIISNLSSSVVVGSNEEYNLSGLNRSLFVVHNESNTFNFTLNSIGNMPTSIQVLTQNIPSGYAISYSDDGINYFSNLALDVTQGTSNVLFMNIVPDKGAPALESSFTMTITAPQISNAINVTVLDDYSWSTSFSAINLSVTANKNYSNQEIIIFNDANNPLSFNMSLEGNITALSEFNGSGMQLLETTISNLATLANRTLTINYTSPNYDGEFNGNITIRRTSGPNQDNIIIPINLFVYNFRTGLYDLQVSNPVLAGDSISLKTNLSLRNEMIVANVSYSVFVGGEACIITSNVTLQNETAITCTLPVLEDATFYAVTVSANYTSSTGEVISENSQQNAVFYKDITEPSINSINVSSITQNQTAQMIINITDNYAVDVVTIYVTLPNSTIITLNVTNVGDLYYANITQTSDIGLYSISVNVYDAEDNYASALRTIEVFNNATFTGIFKDNQDAPFAYANISLIGISDGESVNITSNVLGEYSKQISRKIYDFSFNFDYYNVEIINQSFVNLPVDNFIELDRLTSTDVAVELPGSIKGFSAQGNLTTAGVLTIDYNSILGLIGAEDNLYIYRCSLFNSATKNCLTIWQDLSNRTLNKTSNIISSSFTQFTSDTSASAFMLVEVEPANAPKLSLPSINITVHVNHSSIVNLTLPIENIGVALLQNIVSSCSSNCDWYNRSYGVSLLNAGSSTIHYVQIAVPADTIPKNYSMSIQVTSSDSNPDQSYVDFTIIVDEDKRFNASVSLQNLELGSNAQEQVLNLTVNNTGNVKQTYTLTTNSSSGELALDTYSFSLYRGESLIIPVNVSTTADVGIHNHTIFLTNSNYSKNLTFNVGVSKVAVIDVYTPTNNLQAGELINLSVSSYDLGVPQNVDNWEVYVGSEECIITEQNSGNISCILPNLYSTIHQKLVVKCTIGGVEAFDRENLTFRDVYAPYVVNSTPYEVENVGDVTQIAEELFDDNLVISAIISIRKPSGVSVGIPNQDIYLSNNVLTYNFTFDEVGDYIINYTLSDNLSNIMTQTKTVEVFVPLNFSGIALGLDEVRFGLKKWNDSDIEYVDAETNGSYSTQLHKRVYSELKILHYENEISLFNVNVTEDDSIKNMVLIEGANVSIYGTTNRLNGFALNTSLNFTNGTLRMYYLPNEVVNPSNLAIYKCTNWSFTDGQCNEFFWQYLTSSIYSNYVETTITGFSGYILAEGANPSYVIGDGICSSGSGETNANSPSDCVVTGDDTSNNNGGGGGGSGITIQDLQKELNKTASTLEDNLNKIESSLDQYLLGSELQLDVQSISKQLYTGEYLETKIVIQNKDANISHITLSLSDDLLDLIKLDKTRFSINPGESMQVVVSIWIPEDYAPGIVSGFIYVATEKNMGKLPVDLRILQDEETQPTFNIQPLASTVIPGKDLRIRFDSIFPKAQNGSLVVNLQVIDSTTGAMIANKTEMYLEKSFNEIVLIPIPNNAPYGDYFIQATINYEMFNKTFVVKKTETISIRTPMFTQISNFLRMRIWFFRVYHFIYLIILGLVGWVAYNKLHQYIESKKRYHVNVDRASLPTPGPRTAFLGDIAETRIRTFFELDKMTTHALVAGSTGGGKTVAAQVIIEEALSKGIAVVVFDPTAQWSGFLRKNTDKKMLRLYESFSLKKKDARAFNGNVHLVTDARQKIKIKDIIKPGEINVFALNKLDFKDMDIFVANTVRQVFADNFEESSQLKVILVYDEVHRLLPKFGGSGIGFMQIERACREFRKWGIGIMLISQVLSDFIGQIKANINTEIQMRTRDETDLERIKVKYGDELLHVVVKANVGTGMFQNSAYNKGQPYVVSFRPLLHSLTRLSDRELAEYQKYNLMFADCEYQINKLKEINVDVFDLELELKLASDKLKSGDFSIVDIYIDTLKSKLERAWTTKGVVPEKYAIELVSQEEIDRDVALAKKEFEKVRVSNESATIGSNTNITNKESNVVRDDLGNEMSEDSNNEDTNQESENKNTKSKANNGPRNGTRNSTKNKTKKEKVVINKNNKKILSQKNNTSKKNIRESVAVNSNKEKNNDRVAAKNNSQISGANIKTNNFSNLSVKRNSSNEELNNLIKKAMIILKKEKGRSKEQLELLDIKGDLTVARAQKDNSKLRKVEARLKDFFQKLR
ncbi:MAG: DUF87 domain-containing protein [Candidatus Woesearchaeota archaeon]|jgi:hypothetical protein